MAIRIIHYTPKITNARTQYVTIEKNDMAWIQSEIVRWLALMGALDSHRNQDIRLIQKHWWYKKTSTLPKGMDGQNSPLTFVSGILNNLMFGTQHDLSVIQMEALENISAQMTNFDEAVKELNIGNGNTDSFKFAINFFDKN
jgi:hypothetical protein